MIYRQGDILLKPIEKIPKGVKKKDLVLAEGEVTGHMHQFTDPMNVSCYELNGQQFVDVINTDVLIHNEHDTFSVDKGIYEIIQQREVDLSNEIRKVID